MALPKINHPTLKTNLPSTGEGVSYRPFLVKEEKILLIANESNDRFETLNAIKEIVHACTFDSLRSHELTLYDFEFLFLQIRAASVGETVSLKLKCEKDDFETIVGVDLRKAKVLKNKKLENKIKINDTYSLELRNFNVDDAIELSKIDEKDTQKILVETLKRTIKCVYDEENVYKIEDSSEKEFEEFLDSLPSKTIRDIETFVESSPQIVLDVKWTCEKCGHENTVTLKGIQDFFEYASVTNQ